MLAARQAQQHIFDTVRQLRQDRFNRNKQTKGPDKSIPSYEVGDKIYLHFPKGRFRPPGGSTKLSPNNDGPYTITAKLLDGLVYTVKHDLLHYISNVSVTLLLEQSYHQTRLTYHIGGSSCMIEMTDCLI